MKTNRHIVIVSLLLLASCAVAFAQSSSSGNSSSNGQSNSSANNQSNSQSNNQNDNKESIFNSSALNNSDDAYTVSLGTGQLITLSAKSPTDQSVSASVDEQGQGQPGEQTGYSRKNYKDQLFYGASVYSVYTNSVAGLPNKVLISTSIDPYLAVFIPTRTGRYLFQYSAVLNPNDTSSGGPQAYHSVSMSALGSFNPRWYWTATANASYGSESARFQGPLSFLVVQGTPIANPGTNAVLLRARNVAFLENSLGLGWLKSRRDKIGFTVFHTYTGIQGDTSTTPVTFGNHTNSIGARIDYIRVLTRRVDLRTYGEGETVLNGTPCTTWGGGVGISARLSHSVVVDVRGGPQWTSLSCGGQQNANFAAIIVKNFGNQDKIYASVRRQFTTVARLDSRWEDDAAVGFSKGIRRLTIIGDAGYLRGEPLPPVTTGYHGYYLAPRLRYKISPSLAFSAGYRSFHGVGGNLVSGNLSYALVGIEFYPAPIRLR
jgi:hypothetical protein